VEAADEGVAMLLDIIGPMGLDRLDGHRGPGSVRVLAAAAPLGLAIAVFGVVFGAASSAEFGPGPTIAMSLLVFSGVVQFAVVALLSGGAGIGAILVTVLALNARNLVLGAALRPRLTTTRLRRALLGWFLVDESFGLAIAAGRDAARVLALSGAVCYAGWQVGTLLGVAGAEAVSLEDFATAIFPVLFVGLAAITMQGTGAVGRILATVAIVLVGARLAPDLQPFLPIAAALIVAIPGSRRP
jgi:predicted branched-subunit amino acid permease